MAYSPSDALLDFVTARSSYAPGSSARAVGRRAPTIAVPPVVTTFWLGSWIGATASSATRAWRCSTWVRRQSVVRVLMARWAGRFGVGAATPGCDGSVAASWIPLLASIWGAIAHIALHRNLSFLESFVMLRRCFCQAPAFFAIQVICRSGKRISVHCGRQK